MQEKRNFKRFERNVPVKLQPVESVAEYNESPYYLLTKNICAGGIFLDTKKNLPEGTDVILEIALPSAGNMPCSDTKDQCFLKVRGSVVRSDEEGIALCFKKDFQIEFGDLPKYFACSDTAENCSTNN